MIDGKLAKHIYDTAHLTGRFRLRSGRISNEYFDKYLFESDPELLSRIADGLEKLIPKGTEVLAGLEMGGIPISTTLSLRTGLPAVFVRKKAKEYGTCKLAEGMDVSGKRVLIIEDVVTTGGQIIESVNALRELGANIQNVLCVIKRDAEGRKNLAEAGLALYALYTMDALKRQS